MAVLQDLGNASRLNSVSDMMDKQDLGYACSLSSFNPFCDMVSSYTPSPEEMVNTSESIDINILQIEKELGEGNFGRVVLASHPFTDLKLAIKIMTKEYRELIFTELEVLKMAAGSRFLISCQAFMETPTECYIAMDYMPGGDLQDLMSQWMPFDYETTRFFAAEIICGVQYLHEHGIVHRDLKPDNVLLDKIGHIKIADFGSAAMNVFGEDAMDDFVGTLGYIAPEIMNDEPYNHLVDSFSFGAILYAMTIGTEPFCAQGSERDYHLSLQNDVPVFPPEMCPDAINIIERLLCKIPCGRLAISSIRCHPFFSSTDWDDVDSGRA